MTLKKKVDRGDFRIGSATILWLYPGKKTIFNDTFVLKQHPKQEPAFV